MLDIIEELLNVDSWLQVAVIVAGLAYLGWRQWLDTKRIKSVEATTDAVAEQTASVVHEVNNNSGKSLKDVAERTETATTDLMSAVESLSDKLDAHLSVAVEDQAVLAQLKEKYLD